MIGYIGILGCIYGGYKGTMEKNMEATVQG